MNALTGLLAKAALSAYQEGASRLATSPYRLGFHLMPPVGWLNDPNGLCDFRGHYHVFFQYCPYSARGGLIQWGHYRSEDLLRWHYEGIAIYSDSPWDCHGAYSGSALEEGGKLYLYYTGNVKEEGEHDYVLSGRGATTLRLSSEDGFHFSPKQVAIAQSAYPSVATQHVRDPKLWVEGGQRYLLLGARLKGKPAGKAGSDRGAALLYGSPATEDPEKTTWTYLACFGPEGGDRLGYMWECPDYFSLDARHSVLACSPQGVERENDRFQNVYSAGYWLLERPLSTYLPPVRIGGEVAVEGLTKENFQEWDAGFDFYAPQSFVDRRGRRLLYAWTSVPDSGKEYTNPTVDEGWQHALTVPREITLSPDGRRLCQWPVEELEELRGAPFYEKKGEETSTVERRIQGPDLADLVLEGIEGEGQLHMEEMVISWEPGLLQLRFTGEMGAGRELRQVRIPEGLQALRVLVDRSLVEVYANRGAYCFTSRYYLPREKAMEQQRRFFLRALVGEARFYPLSALVFEGLEC